MTDTHQTPEGTGHRANLTQFQQRALFRLWSRFIRLCQTPAGYFSEDVASGSNSPHSRSQSNLASGSGTSNGDGGVAASQSGTSFAAMSASLSEKRHRATNSRSSARSSTPAFAGMSRVRSVGSIDDHAHGRNIPVDDAVKDELKTLEEAKEMRTFLDRHGGEKLREVFWEMVKGDHPDAVMLRFLRARKWNVDRAIAVIGSTAAFRVENDIAGIMRGGEPELIKTRGGRNLLYKGVATIKGATVTGEPIFFIDVGSHFSHNQTQDELRYGVILIQEWLSLLMPPPIETKVVVFNMLNFSIRNMDWWTVFFMVKTMESYYVETLSRIYVHGAPWIFKPIWAVLRPLLDPVVRDKVRLTFTTEELAEYIPWNRLPHEALKGGLDYVYSYNEPDREPTPEMKDTAKRGELKAAQDVVIREFESATRKVARLYASRSARDGAHQDTSESGTDEEPDEADVLKAQREVLATKLRVAFLRLAPHTIGATQWIKSGSWYFDGRIYWDYPTIDGTHEEQHLGENTTLPMLEAALAAIEAAHGQENGDDDVAAPSAGGDLAEASASNGAAPATSSFSGGRTSKSRPGTKGSRGMAEVLNENVRDSDELDAGVRSLGLGAPPPPAPTPAARLGEGEAPALTTAPTASADVEASATASQRSSSGVPVHPLLQQPSSDLQQLEQPPNRPFASSLKGSDTPPNPDVTPAA